jgi:hypothetical protein
MSHPLYPQGKSCWYPLDRRLGRPTTGLDTVVKRKILSPPAKESKPRTPNVQPIDEITGDHQCRVQCNKSTTDQISCIHHILGEKWKYNGAAHQLLTDFK